MTPADVTVPSITLYVSPDFNEPEFLHELLSGAEEENVPCELGKTPLGETLSDAVPLAFRAAGKSTLGVGIGIDGKGILAVHYEKLPEDSPLFVVQYRIEGEKVRNAAANAARLIKGLPFVLAENESVLS
jgi:hypothetical protein